jgi:pimeloyl-ACP methyl ester carboxylesterase
LAVVVAGADEVIPPESGRRLFRSYPGPKRLWEFPGENHWEGSNRDAAFYREFWNWMTTPG